MKKTITLFITMLLMATASSQQTTEKDVARRQDASADKPPMHQMLDVDKQELAESGTLNRTREWTIEATYEIPQNASGLAWDGTYLYCGIYGVDGDRILPRRSWHRRLRVAF
ncbi:MAG: hypothetical protein U5L09_21075 [Bacteroidales bacterium]|nr:hypothetical protein [Bacteroidales bacterium]